MKAEIGEWMDGCRGRQPRDSEETGLDKGGTEEGVMRLEDQRVQLQTSLAGRCEGKFKEVSVLLLEKQ